VGSLDLLDPEACDPRWLEEGELRARRIACNDEAPGTGEGRKGDVLLQNSRLQVVVRNPWESLTRPGLGGGSLVDVTPRGWRDRLLEAFPLVRGGFLDVEDFDLGVDEASAWVTLRGPGVPFPGVGEGSEGLVEFTWRLPIDSDVVELEGADALWVLAAEGADWVGPGYYLDGFRIGSDGRLAEDLGGAVLLEDLTGLIAAPEEQAHTLQWPEGVSASGSCAGDGVEVFQDGELVGRLAADFESVVPAGAELSCRAAGHEAGPLTAPGSELELSPGAPGFFRLRLVDEGDVDLPALVRWEGGSFPLPPGGGTVPIGPGTHTIAVDAGPTHERWSRSVEIEDTVDLDLVLRRHIDDSDHVLLEIGRQPWPSWRDRTPASMDLREAAATGRTYVVQTPPDEVGLPVVLDWVLGELRAVGGSVAETDTAGSVWSWSWSPSAKRAGHGAPDWGGRAPQDLLALAAGGSGSRITMVDTDWVAAAGEPWTWDPRPDLLRLRDLDDLPVLLDLLSHGMPLGLVGPLTWTPADTTWLPSRAACERGLMIGASTATTGPLLGLVDNGTELTVYGPVRRLEVELQARPSADVEAIELYVDGVLVASEPLDPDQTRARLVWSGPLSRSAIAVATGEDWAITGGVM